MKTTIMLGSLAARAPGWGVAASLLALAVCAQMPLAAAPEASSPPPQLQSTPFVSGTEGYSTFRIPALTVNGAGHLLAICEGRKLGGGDAGDIDTVGKVSADGGKTVEGPKSV